MRTGKSNQQFITMTTYRLTQWTAFLLFVQCLYNVLIQSFYNIRDSIRTYHLMDITAEVESSMSSIEMNA